MAIVHIPEWTIGDRFRKARHYAALQQEDMAREFGVTPATISNWETGISQPRDLLDVVRRWSELTGVEQAWIFGIRVE
jgi:transcriptional regulator with XRE-family HTH domain